MVPRKEAVFEPYGEPGMRVRVGCEVARLSPGGHMPDVLAIAALIVFFSIAVLFVRACERIIGPDLEAEAPDSSRPGLAEPDPDRVAA